MRNVVLTLILIGVVIQFYRPGRNVQEESTSDDFLRVEKAPAHVAKLIKNSCYDCHSNKTRYNWFTNLAPVSWLVDRHVKDGKFGLNFSAWGSGRTFEDMTYKRSIRTASIFDIETNKMPPTSYLTFHPSARLSADQKDVLIRWLYSLNFSTDDAPHKVEVIDGGKNVPKNN